MADLSRIPIPLSQRVRWLSQRILPFAWFLGCCWLVATLWQRAGQQGNVVGEVEAIRVDVAAAGDGILVSLPRGQWTLFDVVMKDEVVARLNDRPLQAALSTLAVERQRLRQELAATEASVMLDQRGLLHDRQQEQLRLRWQREQLRLDVLDRLAAIAVDQAELQRLKAALQYYERLAQRDAVTQFDLEQTRLQRDVVIRRIAENKKAVGEANSQRKLAGERIAEFPADELPDLQPVLAPLQTAVSVQQSRIEEIQLQIAGLEIRAPISGIISAIHSWPGQAIQQGEPVVTIAADHGRYVVSYIRQRQGLQVTPQTRVALRDRSLRAGVFIPTSIEEVGPQVEPIPPHQLTDPAVPEWGLPIRIAIPAGMQLRPGNLVDVRIPRSSSG